MNIMIAFQVLASFLMLIALGIFIYLAVRDQKLKRLFRSEYVKVIWTNSVRRLYPLVPKRDSSKYLSTKRFLTSIGWNISVEAIYLVKWAAFVSVFFMLVTIRSTNTAIELNETVQDVNYKHSAIETLRAETQENVKLEKELCSLVDENFSNSREIYDKKNKQLYIEYIENLLVQHGYEIDGSLSDTAQRLYYKVLQIRSIRGNFTPYVYILLISALAYQLPDILGQIKRKLVEDKKNWEILNCMIVFSIFGRMPPYSVQNILENMSAATEVYKPLFETLIEGLKKGGRQEEAFDAALEAADRDELYELIETMKLARNTGLVNSLDDVDDTISNTIKWIEIENIGRRRTKMLYAMSTVAVVMALGCIYFAYGLTVISNPANMLK